MQQANTPRDPAIVYSYSSEQACEDGILLNVQKSRLLRNSLVSFITINLLIELDILKYDAKIGKDVVNVSKVLDLITQSRRIVSRDIAAKLKEDDFYSGTVRKENGESIRIFIARNETYKYTLMLPSDY